MVDPADFGHYFEVGHNLLVAVRAIGAAPIAHTAAALDAAQSLLADIVAQELTFVGRSANISHDTKSAAVRALIRSCVERLKLQPGYGAQAEWEIVLAYGANDAAQAIRIWAECSSQCSALVVAQTQNRRRRPPRARSHVRRRP